MRVTMNKNVEVLAPNMCFLIDSPPKGYDCSTVDSTVCVRCPMRALYLTGGTTNDFTSAGHWICLMLWIVCVMVCVAGVFGSLLVISVLNRRNTSNKGFDYLLKMLAYIDLCCCLAGATASTCRITFLENWTGRGFILLNICSCTWALLNFFRSASQYMTVVLTIERFLVITFPLKSRSWFPVGTSRMMAGGAIAFAAFMVIPRFLTNYVAENIYRYDKLDFPILRNLDYYMKSTNVSLGWYDEIGPLHDLFDFAGLLMVLLVFNLLSYLQVRKASKWRNGVQNLEKREIEAVKMFLPVVIVLVVLNIVPITMIYTMHYSLIAYRELAFATFLSITLNSAVNCFIYYLKAEEFRKETYAILPPWITSMLSKSPKPALVSITIQNKKPIHSTIVNSSA